ncbi:hypothetical protein QBC34DRAFT_66456 [Podospora aff. communis PSN243]|uniref:Glycoside Hydrolase Family 5 n=1 Tax=Podospora aff. communis PSN243 TaxID=3040156 RepID=A0AAV9H5E8_9PEZI|nr:hypothetical protein QBC34DRAFT_66456 [Podospora aff. communis PSN243]
MGTFINPLGSVLDRYDDMLQDVNSISRGQMKVILSLHDANMIAGFTQPCDAYCQYMKDRGMHWGAFYTDRTIREAFKNRLRNILVNYKSKNFVGRSWRDLNHIIMAINLENEPGVGGNHGLVTGTGWTCDISTFLRSILPERIAVATGAIGGALSGSNNYPDEVFSCAAIDIISLHGYYASSGGTSAGQPWCQLLGGSSSLLARARSSGKLLMAEEWVYNGGTAGKAADITSQGHALNAVGIPWSYWDVMTGSETCSACNHPEVSITNTSPTGAWAALSGVLREANTVPSAQDWSKYMTFSGSTAPITDGTCGTSAGTCTWGCSGWKCSAQNPCQGDLDCNGNSVCSACTWGCQGWKCSSSSPCKDQLQCVSGTCQKCSWGCLGWSCSASSPCSGEFECVSGTCKPCTWGCHGWSCSKSSPCKGVNQCESGVCKPCTWGCPGWQCSASSPCQGDLECKGGTCGDCTWGCLGWSCSASQPCKSGRVCSNGVCRAA